MILLTDRESYNLLAVKLDTVFAIWPSQLGKETPSLKWIPTHLERGGGRWGRREGERKGKDGETEGGREKREGRRNRGREGRREREQVKIISHITSNKTYKTGCLSAELLQCTH